MYLTSNYNRFPQKIDPIKRSEIQIDNITNVLLTHKFVL